MTENQEVELKLELSPGEVDALRRIAAPADPQRRPALQITTYFDTAKRELRKAGFSLRLRKKGRRLIQTVKRGGADSGGFSNRAEWESRVDGPGLDLDILRETPAGALLSKRGMRKRLVAVSETRVRRTAWCVETSGGEVELILDEGEVGANGRRDEICEIELELKKGSRADLFELARKLSEHVTLRMGVLSKSERGFRLLEHGGPRAHKAPKVKVEPGTCVADAFAVIVQSCLRHFRMNEPLISSGRNSAALHQARVALRRLRSALSLFEPVVAGSEFERLRTELRWFAAQLGEARNLDVVLSAKPQEVQADPETRRRLRRARKEAYAAVQRSLSERRLPTLILHLVAWAEAGEWRCRPLAQEPIDDFAAARLDRLWKRVRRRGKALASLTPEERHELRIDVKKLRYAGEFFAGLVAKRQRRAQKAYVTQLQDLQETLGLLNDLETARQLAPQAPVDGGASAANRDALRLVDEAQKLHDALRKLGAYWR